MQTFHLLEIALNDLSKLPVTPCIWKQIKNWNNYKAGSAASIRWSKDTYPLYSRSADSLKKKVFSILEGVNPGRGHMAIQRCWSVLSLKMFYAATYCIQSCLRIGHNNQQGKESSLLRALLPLQITSAWSHVSQPKKDCYGELHKMFLNQLAWCSAYRYNLLLTFRKAGGPGWSLNISNLKV